MTRRLILIDQSIKRPGGHHYEYAKRILDSARAHGLEILLLVHRDFVKTLTHPSRGVFRRTFWDNYQYYYGTTTAERFPASFSLVNRWQREMRLNIKRRVLYSRLGLAMARARHVPLRDALLRPHVDVDASDIRSSRILLLLGCLGWGLAHVIRNREVRRRRFRLWRILWRVLLVALACPLLVVVIGMFLMSAARKSPAQCFAADLIRGLGKDWDPEESLIFVPNATPAELEGLVLLQRYGHAATRSHWAFLFRRPIFGGLPDGYLEQAESVRRHRVELARLKAAAPDLRVSFYCDTEELTAQYNFLGVYPFATLPVPVDRIKGARQRGQAGRRPLVIGYLGDARDEKGFQHLPALVASFAAHRRATAPAPVRFLFQANFNTPVGEPGSRYARHVLSSHEPHFVELVDGPFDSREYLGLLARMDIVLLPYSTEQYVARSSGVLMEALAAGLPVLAPSSSWMARIVELVRQRHLAELFERGGDDNAALYLSSLTGGFPRLNDRVLPVDARANYLFLRLRFDGRFDGFMRVSVTSINEFGIALGTTVNTYKAIDNEIVAGFAKPPSAKIHWRAEAIEATTHVCTSNVDLRFFRSEAALPLCAGVALFDAPRDIPRQVHELVRFYDHHKRAAEVLRDALRPLYDPERLVADLIQDRAAGLSDTLDERTQPEAVRLSRPIGIAPA